jgi:hypothetical protein
MRPECILYPSALDPRHGRGGQSTPCGAIPRRPRWVRPASTASWSTRLFIGSPGVALHPTKRDVTDLHDLDQRLPQVSIGDWLIVTVDPVSAKPGLPPAVPKAIDDVRRVAHDLQRTRQRPHRLQHRRDLHALVSRPLRRPAGEATPRHGPSPTARTWVPRTCAIGVHHRNRLPGQHPGVWRAHCDRRS